MRQHKQFFVRPAPAGAAATVFCAAFVVGALPHDASLAQRATYDAQIGYYDTGMPEIGGVSSSVSMQPYYDSSDYLAEYADHLNAIPHAEDNTQLFAYVGNYGGSVEPQDSSSSLPFFRLTDDVNGNGVGGSIVVITIGPDNTPQLSTLTDFGDLHQFNIAFDQISVARQSSARTFNTGWAYWVYEEGGVRTDPDRVAAEMTQRAVKNLPVEPARVRRGTDSRTIFVSMTSRSRAVPEYSKLAAGHRGPGVAIAMGYQEFAYFDRFRFDADGGILGETYSDTRANNWIMGPYSGFVAHTSIGPLTFYGHALGILGLNNGDLEQVNSIGAEKTPGAVNRLLYAQSTYSQNRAAIDAVSPAGVVWAEAGIQLTEASSLKFAWSAIYVNNILRAEERVQYYLPTMGFRDPGDQDFIQQLFFCGIEWVR